MSESLKYSFKPGMIPNSSHSYKPSWIFGVLFLLFLAYICATPFREIYGLEARNALMAREMLEDGFKLIPHSTGIPYPDYPPLYFWMTAFFSFPFSEVNTFSVVLPSALSAVLLVFITFIIGRELSTRIGIIAALVIATSPDFWPKAGTGMIDMLLALHVSAAILCLYFREKTKEDGKKKAYSIGVPLFITLAFLTKGPIGIVLPAAVWGAFLLWEQRVKDFILFSLFMAFMSVSCIIFELIVVWQQGGMDLIQKVIHMQVTQRVGKEPNEPVYFYIISVIGAAGPWLFWCGPSARHFAGQIRGGGKAVEFWGLLPKRPEIKLVLVWFATIFTLFTIASTRKGRYILPLYPALAVLIAQCIDFVIEKGGPKYFRFWKGFITFAAALFVVTGWGFLIFYPQYKSSPYYCIIIWTITTLAGWSIFQRIKTKSHQLVALTALLLSIALSGYNLIGEVALSRIESGKTFTRASEKNIRPYTPVVLYGLQRDGYGVNYALFSSRKSSEIIYLTQLEALNTIPTPCLIAAYRKDWGNIKIIIDKKYLEPLETGFIHRRPVASYLFNPNMVSPNKIRPNNIRPDKNLRNSTHD